MRTIYIDCIGGVGGDMLLAALLDAGADENSVRSELEALHLKGWALRTERVMRGAISALHVTVTADDDGESRTYRDIKALVEASNLSQGVKRRSLATFERLARAEAKVHDRPLDDVHFHEVGGIDAIVDIVGVCAALESLQAERVVASSIPTGQGFVETRHGTIPLPAPAVVELLAGASLVGRGSVELVTPTGAALLAANCDSFGALPEFELHSSGYGAGTRDTNVPNVVRVLVGTTRSVAASSLHTELIETNIDDTSPEIVGYTIERLLGAGALDAWVTPVQMKKQRTGMLLSVLAEHGATQALLDIIFRETTTLGVRISGVERAILDRKEAEVEVEGHRVRVKLGYLHGEIVTRSPEFEDAAAVARATGLPLKDVYRAALEKLDP
jgi:pyridinium-3,5-bisthiocarboxylic acid mononucleotide nickel chelatase